MKCPKCGYLGFETTDRCRNCQYDFSLTPFASEPELALHGSDHQPERAIDFELPPIRRQTDKLSATALDLDRLFGTPEPARTVAPDPGVFVLPPPPEVVEAPCAPVMSVEPVPEPSFLPEPMIDPALEPVLESAAPEIVPEPEPTIEPEPPMPSERATGPLSEPELNPAPVRIEPSPTDDGALPFYDAPLVPPPAARPPLAVRRSTPELPRNRPRTTRPVRIDALNLEAAVPQKTADTARDATETVASLMEAPSLGVRVGAGLIDLLLLLGVDVAVLFLTLRVTGLQNTVEDLRVLPPAPLVGFLALLAFGYVAAFTVAGGQTIGKMILGLRVIGDDGRPVDTTGGMLRALGCMLVPITLGLSYLPVLFTSEHRALHDRLAGTRVVREQ